MADPFSDAAITAALGRQMTQAVQRQAVAVGNLANLDTPGYRTRDVTFSDALNDELGTVGLAADNPRHFGGTAASGTGANMTETSGLASRRDGNNVQLDRELLGLTRATEDFNAAQTALAAKFKLVRYAISEGR